MTIRSVTVRFLAGVFLGLLGLMIVGCSRTDAPAPKGPSLEDKTAVGDESDDGSEVAAAISMEPQTYETNADQLLSMRLDLQRASDGWVRLFDGHTLFGWEIATEANFRIEDQTIVVDNGDPGLMCTSMPWKDYELQLQYRADKDTNSGVFLRTSLQPTDPATECYEINIAGSDDPYPTGGIVERQKADLESPMLGDNEWHTMSIKLLGGEVTVEIDQQQVCQWTDENPLPAGRIGLQHRRGKIAFRDIQLRPLGMASMIDDELSQWTKYPEMEGEFRVRDESIRVVGGKNQLESKESYGDFTLLAVYELADVETNTGIFYRCIPGDEMMGYECQVNDSVVDGNLLQPADTGTGGIFRRQEARIVPGENGRSNVVVLNVRGLQAAAWVNGIQVSNWYDTREANENPRRGSRREAGTIMIQGHDPATDATFHEFRVSP